MIGSLAIMLFGTTTKLPAFVSSFVDAPGDSADAAFQRRQSSPSRRRETGFRSESPDRQTDCRACPAARSRARPRRPPSSRESDRAGSASPRAPKSRISSVSWTIAGKRSGKPIEPPRIQCERDDEIDDGERHHQRIEVAAAAGACRRRAADSGAAIAARVNVAKRLAESSSRPRMCLLIVAPRKASDATSSASPAMTLSGNPKMSTRG